MSRSVYVASPEGLTGKSAVALGLLDALIREVGSVGVFRPLTTLGGSGPDEGVDHIVEMLVAQPGTDQTYEEALGVTYAQAHDDPDEAAFAARFHLVHAWRKFLFADPGLPDDRKLALLRSLLGGKARPATVRLVEIAVTRSRGRSLETALDDLVDLAAARRARYTAQVRVARPLEADQEARLVAALTRIYGRQVQLQVDVDPEVLGGIEVRVGDEVIDGTVQRNLHNVRRSLAGQ